MKPITLDGKACPAIVFCGPWDHTNRATFPDLSGTTSGHLVAAETLGHGVHIGSTSDPAFYLLTLGKRYQAQGIALGTTLISRCCKRSHAIARDIVYSLSGQRSRALVREPLNLIGIAIQRHLDGAEHGDSHGGR